MDENIVISKKEKAQHLYALENGYKNNTDFIAKVGPKEWKKGFADFYKDFQIKVIEFSKNEAIQDKKNDDEIRKSGFDPKTYLDRLKLALIYISENPKSSLNKIKVKFILTPEMLQYMRIEKLLVNFGTNPHPNWKINTPTDDEILTKVILNSRDRELMKTLKNKKSSNEFDKYLIKKLSKK